MTNRRIVLIGPPASSRCQELARSLRVRGFEAICLPARVAPRDGHAGDILFRRFTGMIRTAEAVVVSSDVPDAPAVTGWVLDQACGLLACLQAHGTMATDEDLPALAGFDVRLDGRRGVAEAAAVLEACLNRPAAAQAR